MGIGWTVLDIMSWEIDVPMHSGHGEVDMESAMIGSCNIIFGVCRASRFGAAEPVRASVWFWRVDSIGINTEASGFLATRWFERRYGRFRLGHTLNAAIGREIPGRRWCRLRSRMQLVANGGTLYRPQIVERTLLSDGQVVEEFEPEVTGQVEAPVEDLEYLTEGSGEFEQ